MKSQEPLTTKNSLAEKLRLPAMVFYEYSADNGALLREAADELDSLSRCLFQMQEAAKSLTAEVAELRRARDAWLQVWDNVKLDNPNLREDNKPLAVAACYGLMKLEMDRMREALVMSVNAMREPFDGWKGEVEALALAAARSALGDSRDA